MTTSNSTYSTSKWVLVLAGLVALSITVSNAAPVTPDVEQIQHDPLIAKTPFGPLKGFIQKPWWKRLNPWDDDSKYTRAWVGVPYVNPPKRFQKGQPLQPWLGVRSATTYSKACPQIGPEIWSEDCLYVNIFAPPAARHSLQSGRKLPIIVFLHGGAYILGSGNQNGLYNGDDIVGAKDVIVVTVNYRLHLFGHMTVPGGAPNLFFHDQRAAIEFVKKVAASFGGNPDEVTLMGQSAGAYSVLAHLTSPTTKPNFVKRAIVMSPPIALDNWSEDRAKEIAAEAAKSVGCDVNDINCLTSVHPLKFLVFSSLKFYYLTGSSRPLQWALPWQPTVDGVDIVDNPLSLIMQKKVQLKVPLVMGNLRDEIHLASVFNFVDFIPKNPLFDLKEIIQKVGVPRLLDFVFTKNYSSTIQELYDIKNHKDDIIDRTMEMATDVMFTCPIKRALADYSSLVPETYGYYLDQVPTFLSAIKMQCSTTRVCHAFDLPLLFQELAPEVKSDVAIANIYQDSFTNFAASSSPTASYNSSSRISWTPFNGTSPAVYAIGRPKDQAIVLPWNEVSRPYGGSNERLDKLCQFWDRTGYFFTAEPKLAKAVQQELYG
ncbi:Alpha/Beta hydrolase protein [Paraphysoderma sedebokerense]|nr:Alpha/Beta hydrolase protein [Paraphysoderma sedebokerense]